MPERCNTPIRQMSPLIIERLRAVFPARLFQIERVPSVLTLSEYQRLTKQSPFIGVAFTGMRPDANSGRQLLCRYQWRLVCVLRATGNLARRFSGDSRDMGMDDITDAAIAVLHAANFKGIGSVIITGAESVYAEGWEDEATTLMHINFEIPAELGYGDLRLEELPEFFGMKENWTVNGEAE